jgi:RNA polymerase sigma factor (sigma-70 family)
MNDPAFHPPDYPEVHQLADHLFRHETGKMVAILTGLYGSHRLQMAEDVVQEALIRALRSWPFSGIPANPAAWLLRTAKNLVIDQLRREKNFQGKHSQIVAELDAEETRTNGDEGGFRDDTLRLMFVCCHPSLPQEIQAALALKTLCGFSPREIAKAFLISEAAVSKRLTRARQRIQELALPFAVPDVNELPVRLDAVLRTLYLLFNEGYKASAGDRLVREDLCFEAIRLTELLAAHSTTGMPRTNALLALMLLVSARLPARTDDAGNLLRLHEQDRSLWDHGMIQRGIRHLGLSGTGDEISEYHLEAGIAACHSTAADDAHTDWPRILALYDQLVVLTDSPIVALNRAVAMARVHGAQAGMDAVNAIANRGSLEAYHLFHAIRGTLAAELGQTREAVHQLRMAEDLTSVAVERQFIARKIRELEGMEGGIAD